MDQESDLKSPDADCHPHINGCVEAALFLSVRTSAADLMVSWEAEKQKGSKLF